MFDRVFFGYVVDMMQVTFIDYPVFNPADNMLVIGTVLLGLYIVFFDKTFLGQKKKQEAETSAEKAEEEKEEK